jgi:acetyltransferase-like isoleucine patch superfamily enzyme
MREQAIKVLASLLPSALRRLGRRQLLKRRHGLCSLGPEFDYQVADNNTFEQNCRLGGPAYVAGSSFGAFSYIEVGCRISLTDVGRFCSIGPWSAIGLAEHPYDFVSTHPIFYRALPHVGYDFVSENHHQELARTVLGHDVWVGHGAIIKGGVSIGHGAIVGAGAIVTRDVPAYAVVAGIPARIVRFRFEERIVDALLSSCWWDRDPTWLRHHAYEMRNVEAFLKLVGGSHNGQGTTNT